MAKRPHCKICLVKGEINSEGRCKGCQDALDATNAGMTYGKYMAQKAHQEQKADPGPLLPGWKICLQCGKRFFATHANRIYCSDLCHSANRQLRQNERRAQNRPPILPKICAICGKEFTPSRNSARIKYCGDECRELAQLAAHREEYGKR